MNEETRLIHESLAGNTTAFGQLVRLHQDRLFNAVAHFVGDRVEAEDVVQDAFVQAFTKLRSFQGNSAFYTWLYRIAFNTAVSRKRRRRAEQSIEVNRDQAGDEPMDQREGPERRMVEAENVQLIREALACLSEEHRAILVLREMDGLDYEAIAEILGIHLGTVRSRLHRARLQLREVLQERMER